MRTRICHLLFVAVFFAFQLPAASLVDNKTYYSVKNPTEEHAETHYAVVTWMLAEGGNNDTETAALRDGQRRAEELILKKWTVQNLKPFVFVNYSVQNAELYLLQKTLRWTEPPGKRAADAITALQQPTPIVANVAAANQFGWVKGLDKGGFATWAQNPANQQESAWVKAQKATATRQLQTELDAHYRLLKRTIDSYEKAVGAGTQAERAAAALRLYEILLGARAQLRDQALQEVEGRLQPTAERVVDSNLKRIAEASCTTDKEGASLQADLAVTLDRWQADDRLKAIAETRAGDIDKLRRELAIKRGAVWGKELAALAAGLDFNECQRRLRTRMIELSALPEEVRPAINQSLWEGYEASMPLAADYFAEIAAGELARGGRRGIGLLLAEHLQQLVSVFQSYQQAPGPQAVASSQAAAKMQEQFVAMCAERNRRQIVMELPATGPWAGSGATLEPAIVAALKDCPWAAGLSLAGKNASDGAYRARDCRIQVTDGQLTATAAGQTVILAATATALDGKAAAAAVRRLAVSYPIQLEQQVKTVTDESAALHLLGCALAFTPADPTTAGGEDAQLLTQLAALHRDTMPIAMQKLTEWLDARRPADLAARKPAPEQ